jgi:hypothetical protein
MGGEVMKATEMDIEARRLMRIAAESEMRRALELDELPTRIRKCVTEVFRLGFQCGHGEGWGKCERFHKWYSKKSEAMPKVSKTSCDSIRWAMLEANRQGMQKHCGELAMLLAASQPME